jgi:hypothetical protein
MTPRISFGIIVLNGEPFTRYNLRALYPFAHEIIVVEGASPNAAEDATADGHSVDGTLEALRRFKEEEDPEGKVQIIIRDGFWEEKDHQSQAYAERATGDYLWQVDIDEFYQGRDMEAIVRILAEDRSITGIAFEAVHFWGGWDYVVESGIMWRSGRNEYRRVFRFGPGYRYTKHRPPTVVDPSGRDVMGLHGLSKERMASKGVYLYHYNAVLPDQVMRRSRYYKRIGWEFTRHMDAWASDTWWHLKRPLHVFHAYRNYSWLKRFPGAHPQAIGRLREDIASGKVRIATRPTEDIEELLSSPRYWVGRAVAQSVERAKALCSLGDPVRVWRKAVSSRLAAR